MAMAVYCTQVGKRQLQVLFDFDDRQQSDFLGIKAVDIATDGRLIPDD
jgi:hypothetical protein